MLKKKSLTSAAFLGLGVLAFLAMGCNQTSGPSDAEKESARQNAIGGNSSKGDTAVHPQPIDPGHVRPLTVEEAPVPDTCSETKVDTDKGIILPQPIDPSHVRPLPVEEEPIVVTGADPKEDSTKVTVHPTPMDPSHVRPMP